MVIHCLDERLLWWMGIHGVSLPAAITVINFSLNHIHLSTNNIQSHILSAQSPCTFITARIRRMGEGNVFTSVCHSVHRREGASRIQDGWTHPRWTHLGCTHPGCNPLWMQPSSGCTPPPTRRQTVNRWSLRVLLEWILVWTVCEHFS